MTIVYAVRCWCAKSPVSVHTLHNFTWLGKKNVMTTTNWMVYVAYIMHILEVILSVKLVAATNFAADKIRNV